MFIPAIGLEIHCELKTKTKMFCSCLNVSDEKQPNVNVCPICLAHPGTLPTINKEAVKMVLKTGLALNCRFAEKSFFERKNYFYPDLPKGYQISQYNAPFCVDGYLEIPNSKRIRITRIHLEEDAGRLIHQSLNSTLVDFNRAGVPLMELVTEPDISSGVEAKKFCEELRLILRYLGVSDANMEKGEMRLEVNISLSENPEKLGVKTEIKNLNSFRAVEQAIDCEIKRQTELLEAGERIVQETRGWNENRQKTFSQRSKEEAQDYRYFPEPDLPPLTRLSAIGNQLSAELPELPAAKRNRLSKEYDLTAGQSAILANNPEAADFFEEAAAGANAAIGDRQSVISATTDNQQSAFNSVFNYLTSDIFGLLAERRVGFNSLKIKPADFGQAIALGSLEKISSRVIKDGLEAAFDGEKSFSEIIQKEISERVFDEEIVKQAVRETIAENPSALGDWQKGKTNAVQFLIGQTMKKLQGKARPEIIKKFLELEKKLKK